MSCIINKQDVSINKQRFQVKLSMLYWFCQQENKWENLWLYCFFWELWDTVNPKEMVKASVVSFSLSNSM